jgi:flagellar basal-body rod modification protein FlgD
MADSIQVNSNTGVDGNSYTSSISNDQLTNEDFLNLMIQELKLQDPTKPMDSAQMLSTQMQMSTIDTNLKMVQSMSSLENSIANMTLSNAMNFMNKKVDAVVDMPVINENGETLKDSDGNTITEKVRASFHINTVKVEDGVTYLESSELLAFKDRAYDGETGKVIAYDFKTGQVKNPDGTLSNYFIKLNEDGMFERDTSGNLIVTDEDGNIKNPKYTSSEDNESYYKFTYLTTDEIYSENNTNIEYKDIVKVY